jgi:hypothetical protein
MLQPSAALALDGCPGGTGPGGTVHVTSAPDGSAYTALLDAFDVPAGETGICDLQVPIMPLPAGVIAVYSADYRGGATLDVSETATLTVQHTGGVDGTTIPGPYNELLTVLYSNLVGSGPGNTINSRITFDLTNASGLFSYGALDSVDYLELARTTMASQQASIDQLAAGQTAITARINGIGALLTGGGQPLEGANEFSLLGAAGSLAVGGTARVNLGSGFSVLGGGAVLSQSGGGATASGVLVSGALRYVQPGTDSFRYYGELGLHGAPGLAMTFTRQYDDGSPGGATVTGSTTGALAAAYVTGGVLYAPSPNNEIAFSGTLMRDWLSVDGYSETFSLTNLFAADVAGGTSTFDVIKAGAAWTTAVSPQMDATISAAVGKSFAHDGVAANVAFVGPVTGAPQGELFAEYGVRLGWELSPTATVDAFALGSTGTVSGTHIQVGTAVKVRF